jgi:hypothetical protein
MLFTKRRKEDGFMEPVPKTRVIHPTRSVKYLEIILNAKPT